MNHWSRLARRVGVSVATAYLVASAAFLLLAATPYGREEVVEGPLLAEYLSWLRRLTVLDWGYSSVGGAPVVETISRTLPATLNYLVPAVLAAVVVGVGVGTYAALNPRGYVDRAASTLSYLGYGTPNFVIGSLLVLVFATDQLAQAPLYDGSAVQTRLWPAALVATTLLASQFRYGRAQAREYADTDLVKLLTAKGAGTLVVARHVLRNAALPLLSLFVADVYAILVVDIIVVESLFAIRGLGWLSLLAVWSTDLPLVLGVTLLFAVVGMGGNLLQDLAAGVLDPRVDDDLYRVVADLNQWAGTAGGLLAARLPDRAVHLLADPERFFGRARGGFALSATVVLAAGLAGLVPTLLVRQAAVTGPATPTADAALRSLIDALAPVARVLVAWLVVTLVLHGLAGLYGGDGRVRDTLRLTAWGWVPVALHGLVAAVVVALLLAAGPGAGTTAGVRELAFAVASHPLSGAVGRLGFVVTAWQGFLWLFAVRHAHGLRFRDAAVVAAVPTAAVLAWGTGVALWGTPGFVRDLPLLPWLLDGGGLVG